MCEKKRETRKKIKEYSNEWIDCESSIPIANLFKETTSNVHSTRKFASKGSLRRATSCGIYTDLPHLAVVHKGQLLCTCNHILACESKLTVEYLIPYRRWGKLPRRSVQCTPEATKANGQFPEGKTFLFTQTTLLLRVEHRPNTRFTTTWTHRWR